MKNNEIWYLNGERLEFSEITYTTPSGIYAPGTLVKCEDCCFMQPIGIICKTIDTVVAEDALDTVAIDRDINDSIYYVSKDFTNNAMLKALQDIIHTADSMQNAYFFKPPMSAGDRRAYEKRHSFPEVSWTEGKHTYSAEYITTCSCKNVYAAGSYTRDGKKTTLTAIRNSFNRMISKCV